MPHCHLLLKSCFKSPNIDILKLIVFEKSDDWLCASRVLIWFSPLIDRYFCFVSKIKGVQTCPQLRFPPYFYNKGGYTCTQRHPSSHRNLQSTPIPTMPKTRIPSPQKWTKQNFRYCAIGNRRILQSISCDYLQFYETQSAKWFTSFVNCSCKPPYQILKRKKQIHCTNKYKIDS